MKRLGFQPRALTFLRALKRNNDREWFKARKEQYDELLRAPMLAIIEQLALDFQSFAPDLVASPKVSMYRIYRDTRFSEDKSPLKTHVAAMFPCRGLAKNEGAGLYFHVALDGVWVGGGMYAPDTSHLQAERDHIAANIKHFRAIRHDSAVLSASSRVIDCSACRVAIPRITKQPITSDTVNSWPARSIRLGLPAVPGFTRVSSGCFARSHRS